MEARTITAMGRTLKIEQEEMNMDEKKLKQLADYAVREGLEHSEDGHWAVSYE